MSDLTQILVAASRAGTYMSHVCVVSLFVNGILFSVRRLDCYLLPLTPLCNNNNNNNDSLCILLLLVFCFTDRTAEARLSESLQSNYAELAKALALEIATDGKPIESRQMASLYLKNTLNGKSVQHQSELHERWKMLDTATRNTVKDTLMRAMTTLPPVSSLSGTNAVTNQSIPRFAAIAASEVACVELPYQEWPNFIPAMTAAVNTSKATTTTATNASQQSALQLAAYECLGLTCERIEEVQNMMDSVPDLPEQTVNAMLTTIVQGVTLPETESGTATTAAATATTTNSGSNNNTEIRYAALNALNKSLQFVHRNMEKKEERDFIISHAIGGATQSSDARIRQLAYQCLDVVGELYYDKLADYMTQIFQLTTNAIQTDQHEDVKIAAIEFWCTIAMTEEAALAEEELASHHHNDDDDTDAATPSLCNKYVESAMPLFVPLLLDTLSSSSSVADQEEDYDEDVFDLRAVGAICLESFSQTVGNLIVPIVMPFVQQNIMNHDVNQWRLRDAAIVAFSCILAGPTTLVMGPYVHQSIPVLLAAFTDPHETIRDDATHCIANISKLHLSAIQPDQVHAIIQGLIVKLQESPKLAGRACAVIFNMSMSLKTPDGTMPDTNVLSAPMLPLMQALLAAMDRHDALESNLRVSAMSAASELITASAVDVQPILRDLLPAITARFDTALKMDVVSNDDREMKEQMLGLLAGLVTSLYQRLEKQDVVPHTDRVVAVILQVLQVPNANCHEEAFLAVGAIATALEEDFTVRVNTTFAVPLNV
jgi:importin subunit beta-1